MKSLLSIFILSLSLAGFHHLSGQDRTDSVVIHRNSVFIEFGGSVPMLTINYDHLIPTRKEKIKYAFTFGVTHHFNKLFDIVLAPQFNTLFGRKLMAEVGLGLAIPAAFIDDWVLTSRLGIRHQKPEGGLFYRISLTPIISLHQNESFLPMAGLSIGYTFK